MHLRADDGIRTRDPHLGKVMRYQLRYIRAQRARSSSGAKQDTSPLERTGTNREVLWGALVVAGSDGAFIDAVDRASLPPRCRSAPVPWLSGRASASHAEGRWFDPSRDHKVCLWVFFTHARCELAVKHRRRRRERPSGSGRWWLPGCPVGSEQHSTFAGGTSGPVGPARGGGAARSAVATGADQLGPAAVAAVPAHAWPTAAMPARTAGSAVAVQEPTGSATSAGAAVAARAGCSEPGKSGKLDG